MNKANIRDLLSITTTIIVVIWLANKKISLCQRYDIKMNDTSSDLQAIFIKVNNFKSVIISFKYFLSTWDKGNILYIVKSLKRPKRYLKLFRKVLVASE